MDLRKGLGESFRKGEVDGKKKTWCGSRAYRKFFEDYEEIRVPKENGRGSKIERIYRGDYYRRECSDGWWYAMKGVYLLLAAASAWLFGFAALPSTGANRVWYVTVPQAVSIVCYLWLFRVLCSYIAAPRNMTVSEWKRACKPLRLVLRILSGGILVTAAGTLAYYLSYASEFDGQVFTYLMAYLLGAVLIGFVYFAESRTVYRKGVADTGIRKEDKNGDFKRKNMCICRSHRADRTGGCESSGGRGNECCNGYTQS